MLRNRFHLEEFAGLTSSDLLVIGDQQKSDRSFRHCPNNGEVLTSNLNV